MFERISLAAATRTDGLARVGDRMSEISRGHSRWMQAGEGLKALFAKAGEWDARVPTDKPNRSPIEGPNGPR